MTTERGTGPATPREPTLAPASSEVPSAPAVKVKTVAQQAQGRKKLQKLTEKRKARALVVT